MYKLNFLGNTKKNRYFFCMILKGPILIPEVKDKSGDVLDEETIRKAALVIGRNGVLIDAQHKLGNVGRLLEQYIIDEEYVFHDYTYPKGTLFVSVEVTDDEIKNAIREGKLTGFSIMAAPKHLDRGVH